MAREVLRSSDEEGGGEVRVTHLELFFDLVYVFAITQLSEFVYGHQGLRGLLQALLLFVAVFWAWNYTAWATNWMDPRRGPAALLMIALMVLSLIMAAALPDAFGSRGAPFAIAYALLQVVRTGFVALAFERGSAMRANNLRLLAWLVIAGVVWILGGYLDGDVRIAVWIVAAAIDMAAPMHGFWLPGVGSTPIERWRLTGGHLAERYQLVLMIALGESVLRVGLTWSEQRHGSFRVDVAFVLGFLSSASLWALYFSDLAEQGAQRVASAGAAGARIGRSGYAYAHAVMVAGVILVAVGIRMAIDDPHRVVWTAAAIALLAGPALYLAGLAVFKRAAGLAGSRWSAGGPVVLALCVIPAVLGIDMLALLVCVTVLLLVLAIVVRPLAEHAPGAAT